MSFGASIRILEADSLHEIRRMDGYYGFARRVFLSSEGKTLVAVTGDQNQHRSQLNVWLDSHATRAAHTWESNRPGDFGATTLSPDQKTTGDEPRSSRDLRFSVAPARRQASR